jgi:hypothetical protein
MIKDVYGNTRFFGVYRGVVTEVNAATKQIKALVPQILGSVPTGWAWMVQSSGLPAVMPSTNQGVWVMFEGGDPSYPIWTGTFNETPSALATATAAGRQEQPAAEVGLEIRMESVIGGTTGTQPTFSGSPKFTGSYTKIGVQVHFRIDVDMDNITGFGTGQYYLDLPFPSKYNYELRDGCLHDISASKTYAISGHVLAGESRLYLFSTDTQSSHVFDIAFDYNSPVTLSTADNFHISGNYITNGAQ